MKIRFSGLIGCLALILAAGCTFPRLGPATQPPPSTPLSQLTPTFPPLPSLTPNVGPVIPHLTSGTQVTLSTIQMVSLTIGWAIGTAETEPNSHILHTTDGGLTWKDVTPPEALDTNGNKEAITYFADDNNVWVSYSIVQSTLYNNRATPVVVWVSHDGGKNWSASQPLDVSPAAEFFQPGMLAFADIQHGWLLVHVGVGMSHDYFFLFSTINGGLTWNKVIDPTTMDSPQVCCKADMWFTNSTHGWLAGNTHGVVPGIFFYQTTDAGQSWSLVNLPAPSAYPDLFTTQDFVCGTYEIQFADPSRGFVGVECFSQVNTNNLGWLYVTKDGGGTWVPENVPQPQGLFHFISPGQGWYVADKVYQTTDGGLHWTPVATVTWTGVPDFVDSNNGWLVASKDNALALVYSSDAGVSWASIIPVIEP